MPRPVGPYHVIYTKHEDYYTNDDGDDILQGVEVHIVGITTADKVDEHIQQVRERVHTYHEVYSCEINEFYEWQDTDEIFRD